MTSTALDVNVPSLQTFTDVSFEVLQANQAVGARRAPAAIESQCLPEGEAERKRARVSTSSPRGTEAEAHLRRRGGRYKGKGGSCSQCEEGGAHLEDGRVGEDGVRDV